MATAVKNSHETLSGIIEDLFAKAKKGEDIASTLHRLRDEVNNASENEGTVYATFLRLLDSFREIIPEEKLRYQAAVAALSTTAKLDEQKIVQAIGENLGELKANIAKLRETLGRLEKDEREISSAMIAREKAAGAAGSEGIKKTGQVIHAAPASRPVPAVQPPPVVAAASSDIFPDRIEKNIIDQKIVAGPAPQPVASNRSAAAPVDIFPDRIEKNINDKKVEVPAAAAALPGASPRTKKCSMCGGQMSFSAGDKMWMCIGCGYAESGMIEIENRQIVGGVIKDGLKSASLSAPPVQDSAWQHRCPMCGGQMNYHGNEKLWLCYSCAYEESHNGGTPAPGKSIPSGAEEPFFPAQAPATLSGGTEPIRGSLAEHGRPKARQSAKKKPCPSCRKKMTWHEEDRAWRCPFCEYERRI